MAQTFSPRPGTAPLPSGTRNPLTGFWHADGYGAKGDGATNDRAAIQAAIDACSGAGGGKVFVKRTASYYRLDSGLTPKSGVTVLSDGALMKMTINSSAFVGTTDNFTDFTLDGLVFEGGVTEAAPTPTTAPKRARAGTVTGMTSAVYLVGDGDPSTSGAPVLTNFFMRNCTVRNCDGLPIFLKGVRGAVQVESNRFFNNRDVGFVYCSSVMFADNYVYGSADNGVSISRGCKKVVCADNTFENCAYNGIWVAGYGTEIGPQNFTVTGNVVLNVGYAGIWMDNAPKYGTVMGNTLDGAYRRGPSDASSDSTCVGIFIGGTPDTNRSAPTDFATDINIVGNEIRRFPQAGIYSPGGLKRVTIALNLIDAIGTQYLADGTTAVVSTDLARNIGILIDFPTTTTSQVSIIGNKVTDSRATPYCNHAMQPAGSSVVIAANNEMYDCRNMAASIYETGSTKYIAYTPIFSTNTKHTGGADAGSSAATGTIAGFSVNGAAASVRHNRFKTAGVDRWSEGSNGNAESGSNAGSDFELRAYTDAGAYLGSPLTAKRSNLTVAAGKGFVQATKAGAPVDGDFATVPSDGTTVLDTTNNRLYVRSGGTWRYSALT